jgi:NADH-quinone oxidoreductase subunit L
MYTRFFPARAGRPLNPLFNAVRTAAQNKFYVDELYEVILIRPVKFLSFMLYNFIDKLLIDTIAVRGTAWVTARLASVLRLFQTGDAQSYAAVMAVALVVGIVLAMLKVWGGLP